MYLKVIRVTGLFCVVAPVGVKLMSQFLQTSFCSKDNDEKLEKEILTVAAASYNHLICDFILINSS